MFVSRGPSFRRNPPAGGSVALGYYLQSRPPHPRLSLNRSNYGGALQEDQSNPPPEGPELCFCFLLPAEVAAALPRLFSAAEPARPGRLRFVVEPTVMSALWPQRSLTCSETGLQFMVDSWLRRGPRRTCRDSPPLFAGVDLEGSGGMGTGRLVIGFRDAKDLGGAAMMLLVTASVHN
jgi:hypothetical protein